MTPPAPHRGTTAHVQALYPFVAEAGFGPAGIYIGRDRFGGSFCFDPWELYRRGVLTSPNLLVLGQIGRGKSTFVKTFLWRQQVFGRQAWVVDPKGEYAPLAEACDGTALRVAPGGTVRLNPLDTAAGDAVAPVVRVRRQAELMCSLASASLARALSPAERTAVELGVAEATRRQVRPTLPCVVAALLDPDPAAAAAIRTDVAGLAADGRQVALDLRRLVEGDLAGMFDGPTSPGIDLDRPLVVLDLSALYGSPALGILMACATAWLQARLGEGDGTRRLVVVDEAWAILHDLAMARWLQAAFKLSRAFGVANMAVVHRLSDLRAVGAEGSEQQRLAEGLLADSETRVIFGQPPSEVAAAQDLLGLTGTEAGLLPHLPRGMALWKVADRSFLVEHRIGSSERRLIDTDQAMRAAPR
jgi:DNA helicase HerA-like ATPase